MRAFIKMAAACKKPDTKSFSALLVPLQAGIEAITRLKEANRKDRDWFTHLSVVAEGGPIVGWVQAEPKPAAYVSEVKDSMQYYGNRVIKESGSKSAIIKHFVDIKSNVILTGILSMRSGSELLLLFLRKRVYTSSNITPQD